MSHLFCLTEGDGAAPVVLTEDEAKNLVMVCLKPLLLSAGKRKAVEVHLHLHLHLLYVLYFPMMYRKLL